jgi:nucleoside-diphosphate-sugar epimerase
MASRTALVLGATGMVGRPLCIELLERGWNVHAAARLSDPASAQSLADRGIEVMQYDVTRDDPDTLPEVDTVFLEVWDPKLPEQIWPINFFGIGRVVERYCGRADIVNGCTVNVYGGSSMMKTEDFPPRPDNDYGRSRYAQERLIDYFAFRGGRGAIHIRYEHSNSADSGIVRRTAEAILEERSLGDAPDQKFQIIALEDFVRVTASAADRVANPPAIVNCCHPRVWTMRELAEAIHRRLGRGRVIFDAERGGEDTSVHGDPTRMIEWFGEPAVDLDEVIGRACRSLGA